jgi:hypothetical protein
MTLSDQNKILNPYNEGKEDSVPEVKDTSEIPKLYVVSEKAFTPLDPKEEGTARETTAAESEKPTVLKKRKFAEISNNDEKEKDELENSDKEESKIDN